MPVNARPHPPRRQHEQEFWNTRRRFVYTRASSTTQCGLSALIDDALCIARSRWTWMNWGMKNEWSR
jgi:hypothetical protein